jgi:hypothetical protein
MITDELRKWMRKHHILLDGHTDLDAIVDRIDEKHEREMQQAHFIPRRYTLSPVDADGDPVHIGDVMDCDDATFTVHELKFSEAGWTTWSGQHNITFFVKDCHHHKTTVEDVLREMMQYAACKFHDDGTCEMGLTAEQFAKYAQRLQLRESTDD